MSEFRDSLKTSCAASSGVMAIKKPRVDAQLWAKIKG
jgi:hypothetical protein